MKISFLDFWAGFDPNNNLLTSLIKELYPDSIVASDASQADLIIYSCFGWSHTPYDKRKKIFYTGENARPNYDYCSLAISFDPDTEKNIRLPLWNIYIDWSDLSYLQHNKYHDKQKTKFCSFVYSNPTSIRQEIVNKLSTYKPVDCYGKIHALKIPDTVEEKLEIISNYKFNLCFENSNSWGYYTEKLLHSKIANCIPLYSSDKHFVMDFNEKCCINLCDYQSTDAFVQAIIELDQDDELYSDMLSEPIFNSEPSLSVIKKRLGKFLSSLISNKDKITYSEINLLDLKVYQSPTPKIRIGKDYDGGYVIASDKEYDLFLSGGICEDISFEEDFISVSTVKPRCYAFDGTIPKLPKESSDIIFKKLNIGHAETDTTTNLIKYLDIHNNVFIKMDIEGYEYEWINSLEDKHLASISQLVIEFHHPYEYYKWVILLRLMKFFTLIHFHANVCGGECLFMEKYLPRVFECTFIRKIPDEHPSLISIPDTKLDQSNRSNSFDWNFKNGHTPFDL